MAASKNNFGVNQLAEVLFKDLGLSKKNHFSVAFSGGMDSCVLLDLMAQLKITENISVNALHFNHGLQNASDQWAEFCREFCEQRNIPLSISSLKAAPIKVDSKKGLEASAREARYAWFKQQLLEVAKKEARHKNEIAASKENDIMLLTAHHANDQAETVLFNLIRGAGISGLRGIAQASSVNGLTKGRLKEAIKEPIKGSLRELKLVRPLLNFTHSELQQYALTVNLKWVEDPSNQDQKFSRNKLRHQILPLLNDVKQDAVQQITKASQHIAEAESLLKVLAEQDLMQVDCKGYCPLDGSYAISLNDLKTLQEHSNTKEQNSIVKNARVKNVLKYWLTKNVAANINARVLNELLLWVAGDVTANSLIEFGEYDIRHYRGYAYAMPKALPIFSLKSLQQKPIQWTGNTPLQIDELSVEIENRNENTDGELQVFFADQAMQGRLKKKFQSVGVPSWRRGVSPVIRQGDELVCLAYERVCFGFYLGGLD